MTLLGVMAAIMAAGSASAALADDSTTILTISPNPPTVGETVTLTATVSSISGNVHLGQGVAFTDNGDQIGPDAYVAVTGSDPLTGTATLTTTFTTAGSHDIFAVFNGDGINSFQEIVITVNPGTAATADPSARSRAMQVLATRMEALNSGQAFTGAIDSAIDQGLGTGGSQVTASPNGDMHLNFVPEDNGPAVPWPGGAGKPSDWRIWADLRGTSVGDLFTANAASTISGLQLNALVGIGHKVTPNLLVGVIGGYETASYHSDDLDADLAGRGWTVGGYAGADLGSTIRAFAAAGYTRLSYDASAGGASGSFDAGRWLLTGGVSGDIDLTAVTLEPSLNLFGLWEHQEGYVDSLGTDQSARDFEAGRISAGVKLLHPVSIEGAEMLPYAGIYADYSTSGDVAGLDDLGLGGSASATSMAAGVSGRLTGGISSTFDNGAKFHFGAEVGGLGAAAQYWTLNAGFKQAF